MRDHKLKTRDRILRAAELLFAVHSYHGTSLRDITHSAEVNLAAVNYHFSDKDRLYIEIIRRRIQPLNHSRSIELEQAISLAGNNPPPLSLLLEILARPYFDLHGDQAEGGHCVARLVARCFSENLPFAADFMAIEFHAPLAKFSQAIRHHAPNLSPETFLWRFSLVIGMMLHTLSTLHVNGSLTQGVCKNNDHDNALRHFVTAASAIFTQSEPKAH